MPFLFEADYDLGETVYLRHASTPGIVRSVEFDGGGPIYTITWTDDRRAFTHYAHELSREPSYAGASGDAAVAD